MRVTLWSRNYADRLETSMRVNVKGDHDDVHPEKFWNTCYRAMTRYDVT